MREARSLTHALLLCSVPTRWRRWTGSRRSLARRLLVAFEDLETEFELKEPLLLVVGSQLECVVRQLLEAVPLELPSKLCYLRLELLVGLHLLLVL